MGAGSEVQPDKLYGVVHNMTLLGKASRIRSSKTPTAAGEQLGAQNIVRYNLLSCVSPVLMEIYTGVRQFILNLPAQNSDQQLEEEEEEESATRLREKPERGMSYFKSSI